MKEKSAAAGLRGQFCSGWGQVATMSWNQFCESVSLAPTSASKEMQPTANTMQIQIQHITTQIQHNGNTNT